MTPFIVEPPAHLKVLPEGGVLADLLLVLGGKHLQLVPERLQLLAHLGKLVLLGADSTEKLLARVLS